MSQGRNPGMEDYPEYMLRWRKALRAALGSGWTVHHIWRLDSDRERVLSLVNYVIHLLDPRRHYHPSYFPE